jgi:RNA polymerase sigma factor (sigma-70 family)
VPWPDSQPSEPLSGRQRLIVVCHLPRLGELLRQRRFAGYCHLLGYAEAYQVGALAFCRAAKSFDPELGVPFHLYAAFWLKKYLIGACAAEARDGGCQPLGDDAAPSNEPSPAHLCAVRELASEVLRVLPPTLREALELRAAGHSFRETGELLGKSRSLAGRWHERAKERVWRLAPHVWGEV